MLNVTQPFLFDFMVFFEPIYLILIFCIIYILIFSCINFKKELFPLCLVAFFLMFMVVALMGTNEYNKQKEDIQKANSDTLEQYGFVLISPSENDAYEHLFFSQLCEKNNGIYLLTNEYYHYDVEMRDEYKGETKANLFCKGIL